MQTQQTHYILHVTVVIDGWKFTKLFSHLHFLPNSTFLQKSAGMLRVCVKLLATWMFDTETSPRSLISEAGAKIRVAEQTVQPRYLAECSEPLDYGDSTSDLRKIQRQTIGDWWFTYNTGVLCHVFSAKWKFVSFRNFEAGDGPVINHT